MSIISTNNVDNAEKFAFQFQYLNEKYLLGIQNRVDLKNCK